MSAADVIANLDGSLKRLKTDYVDVYLLHGVSPAAYERARKELVPALAEQKQKGKIRHIGVSETSPNDPEQRMLQAAIGDPIWEVAMFAFHMMNQVARRAVFPGARQHGVGTLLMFVVRNIFSRPGLLAETLVRLAADEKVPKELAETANPLGFLIHEGGAMSLQDAAYRFARHEPGGDVVLFGTSSSEHLRQNVASMLRPPLPAGDVARLYELFGALRGVGLDLPDRIRG
jgi:L-galactose dehydrogenase